ncbi:hypothetical protein PAL_GLEAN10025867 [Pteropus alecto]|uniref:Uncharacterized protein n=1 Tax=Pteropus alecto TaxID=9402 RepID=L5JYS7_PTEAL|nr:hypothetical protein PAL_GLEAN10025867 [Pteropus alecto]
MVISLVGVKWVKSDIAVSRGVQIAFAACGPNPAGPSATGVVSACGYFGPKLRVPAVRGASGRSWARSGGRARGGIVSGARSSICLLEVLAERAWCSAAVGWKCQRWPRPRGRPSQRSHAPAVRDRWQGTAC